jgi:hypothetical protein
MKYPDVFNDEHEIAWCWVDRPFSERPVEQMQDLLKRNFGVRPTVDCPRSTMFLD